MLRSVVVTASFIALGGFGLHTLNVSAVNGNTEIRTLVCDTSSSASLIIDSPLSDSVISSSPLTVSGSVNRITQIDIMVDGAYSNTVPLSAGQTTFTTQVSLNPGTHTIVLTGNDACQVQNPQDSLVITYQQQAAPSNTDTTSSGGGLQTPPDNSPLDTKTSDFEKLPVVRTIAPWIRDFSRAIDFDNTARDGGLLAAMLRFALFTLGLGLLLFASAVLRLLRQMRLRDVAVEGYIKGKRVLADPDLKDHVARNGIILRSLGVVLLSSAFLV